METNAEVGQRLSEAKQRVLDHLKRSGPRVVAILARDLGLTPMAVRQHLQVLEFQGLVEPRTQPPKGRGRPSVLWALTGRADTHFPDGHAELTVGLIEAARKAFGERGLSQIVAARADEQVEDYRRRIPVEGGLAAKVGALAELRTAEGYMAEALEDDDGWLLVEHHCPICDAAKRCVGLCAAELDVFRRTLGDNVHVERTRHLLAEDDRCAYRIRQRH